MGFRHARFLARTVLVKDGDVEAACRLMNRILGKEEIFQQYRLIQYYEKPFQTRRRINYEKCKAIYNEDMDRKIQFVLRKNRVPPFPDAMADNAAKGFERSSIWPFNSNGYIDKVTGTSLSLSVEQTDRWGTSEAHTE